MKQISALEDYMDRKFYFYFICFFFFFWARKLAGWLVGWLVGWLNEIYIYTPFAWKSLVGCRQKIFSYKYNK